MSAPFDPTRFAELRRERGVAFGDPLTFREVTGSTNDDALLAARSGALHGATFVAERQTAGRGRRGRSFYGETGASLLFTVVVRPRLELDRVSSLALAAGIAVRRAIARALPSLDQRDAVRIKWPNDVWADGKKIAGVLAETQLEAGTLRAAVIGVGVNVGTTRFPIELEPIATSIAILGGVLSREALLADVLQELERTLPALEDTGLTDLHNELSRYDAIRGRRIRVDQAVGTAAGIDSLGRLLVRLDRGDLVPITTGTIELDDVAPSAKLQP